VRMPAASFFFGLIILAYSLSRLWRRILSVFPVRCPRGGHLPLHHSHSLGLQMHAHSLDEVRDGGGRSKRGDETVTAELELEGRHRWGTWVGVG